MDVGYYENIIKNHRLEKQDLSILEEEFNKLYTNDDIEEIIKLLYYSKIINFNMCENRISDIIKYLKLNIKDIETTKKFINIFLKKNEKQQILWPMSNKILSKLDDTTIIKLLDGLKAGYLGNWEEYNKIAFIKENLPLINIMDYALKNKKYNLFYKASEKIEPEYLKIYFDMNKKEMKEYILENIHDKDIYLIFSFLPQEAIEEYLPINFLDDLNELSFDVLYILINNDKISKDKIITNEFIEYYKKLNYKNQVIIINLFMGMDYPTNFIKQLRDLLNVKSYNIEIKQEIPYEDIKKLYEEITTSSYYNKHDLKSNSYIIELEDIIENNNINELISSGKDYYGFLIDQYNICRNYATNSIINSLYDVSNLQNKINYMEKEKYNILARVQTFWDDNDLEKSFNLRTFAGFSIITENNFSHYPGNLLMGYYQNITNDMIHHIYPMDSLSESYAKYSRNLTKKYNMLYDIDDLNEATYIMKTYNQLCINTKDKYGNILRPNCAICTDEKELDNIEKLTQEKNLKILVLKKNTRTIEYNRDIYGDIK